MSKFSIKQNSFRIFVERARRSDPSQTFDDVVKLWNDAAVNEVNARTYKMHAGVAAFALGMTTGGLFAIGAPVATIIAFGGPLALTVATGTVIMGPVFFSLYQAIRADEDLTAHIKAEEYKAIASNPNVFRFSPNILKRALRDIGQDVERQNDGKTIGENPVRESRFSGFVRSVTDNNQRYDR